MRSINVFAALLLVTGFVVATASFAAARGPVACVEGVGSCPGVYCADTNLDGRFQWDECQHIYCVTGCCYECPPPYE